MSRMLLILSVLIAVVGRYGWGVAPQTTTDALGTTFAKKAFHLKANSDAIFGEIYTAITEPGAVEGPHTGPPANQLYIGLIWLTPASKENGRIDAPSEVIDIKSGDSVMDLLTRAAKARGKEIIQLENECIFIPKGSMAGKLKELIDVRPGAESIDEQLNLFVPQELNIIDTSSVRTLIDYLNGQLKHTSELAHQKPISIQYSPAKEDDIKGGGPQINIRGVSSYKDFICACCLLSNARCVVEPEAIRIVTDVRKDENRKR